MKSERSEELAPVTHSYRALRRSVQMVTHSYRALRGNAYYSVEMNFEQALFAQTVAKEQILAGNTNEKAIASALRHRFDEKYGPWWQCIVGSSFASTWGSLKSRSTCLTQLLLAASGHHFPNFIPIRHICTYPVPPLAAVHYENLISVPLEGHQRKSAFLINIKKSQKSLKSQKGFHFNCRMNWNSLNCAQYLHLSISGKTIAIKGYYQDTPQCFASPPVCVCR
uniref:Dynein light chain n=1 Tax=Parascaris equorum TaxID=6256 RepID=A0A914S6B3_PAREQ